MKLLFCHIIMDRLAAFNEFNEQDEDDLERDVLGRITREYFDRIHPFERYREKKFQARYRLTRNISACLADQFGESIYATWGRPNGGGLSHRDRFCLALRYYATGSFYGAIGDTQGVHKSTVCRAVQDVTEYLYSQRENYIHFPRENEYVPYSQDFARINGFPCVIGALDGTHISIQTPNVDERTYVNRNWYHSLNVMGVCDAFLRFTYIDSRFPGGAHDSFVFRRSPLAIVGERRVFDGYWFLGDSGYPLKPFLLTPVLNPENDHERLYNERHSQTRGLIECAFGVWKRRFRCLDDSGGMLLQKPKMCAKIIIACAVLHNIAVQHNLVIRLDNDWDGRQRPQRRRADVEPEIFAPTPEQLENEFPPAIIIRRRLINARF